MYKIRKNSTANIIFEHLIEFGFLTLDAFFPKKYSFTAISRPLFGLDKKKSFSKNALYVTLARLKKEKLIIKTRSGWKITQRGTHAFTTFEKRTIPKEDGVCRLVIFDIPEIQRTKRDRIRLDLLAHEFIMLQKSVWMGYRPLSEEFLELIDALNLRSKVHIFSVQHQGTLKKDS